MIVMTTDDEIQSAKTKQIIEWSYNKWIQFKNNKHTQWNKINEKNDYNYNFVWFHQHQMGTTL